MVTGPFNIYYKQGLQEKFCKAEQDFFGAPGQAETSLKIEDLRSNKTTAANFHKCFISCAAEFPDNIYTKFYIIIFLNKLNIVENPLNKIKCLWLRLWGPSEIHRPHFSSPGPGPMYRLNPSHRP